MEAWSRMALGVAILLVVATVVGHRARLGVSRAQLTASARAVVQLAVVATALRGVFAQPALTVVVVAVMLSTAVVTAARRLQGSERAWTAVVLGCVAGSTVTVGVIVGLPTLDRDVRTLVAVSGIVIGGTMTAATLAGRHLREGLLRRRDEVEAWLAIGATPREAVRDVARAAAAEALVPGLDQTRTVGLVTLPGAFVGALLGGASPVAAAEFQLVVLIGLLCAQVITATIVVRVQGAPSRLPVP
ncbi:ABC transporter permease [Jatrophihabitans sp. YIM 134969]